MGEDWAHIRGGTSCGLHCQILCSYASVCASQIAGGDSSSPRPCNGERDECPLLLKRPIGCSGSHLGILWALGSSGLGRKKRLCACELGEWSDWVHLVYLLCHLLLLCLLFNIFHYTLCMHLSKANLTFSWLHVWSPGAAKACQREGEKQRWYLALLQFILWVLIRYTSHTRPGTLVRNSLNMVLNMD